LLDADATRRKKNHPKSLELALDLAAGASNPSLLSAAACVGSPGWIRANPEKGRGADDRLSRIRPAAFACSACAPAPSPARRPPVRLRLRRRPLRLGDLQSAARAVGEWGK